jgi:hypothetical protein
MLQWMANSALLSIRIATVFVGLLIGLIFPMYRANRRIVIGLGVRRNPRGNLALPGYPSPL